MLCNDPQRVEQLEKRFGRKFGVGGLPGCGNGYKCLCHRDQRNGLLTLLLLASIHELDNPFVFPQICYPP